jgi:hypothetical protein
MYPISPEMGTVTIIMIHATIVWLVFSAYRRERIGQVKAPAIPDEVAVIDNRATATVPILSSVRANIIAVLPIVAIASERRNQATRNIATCRSLAATLMVFHNDRHANDVYVRKERQVPPPEIALRGDPGRLRSHNDEGMVKANHHRPTINKTRRKGRVEETEVFDMPYRSKMLRTCTNTAAT